MADNSVFITGVASGAFSGDIKENLPAWATEKTLVEIRKTLQVQLSLSKTLMSKMASGGAAGLNPKDVNEFGKELREIDKTLNASNKGEKAREKKRQDQWDKELLFGKKLETNTQKLLYISDKLYSVGMKVISTMKENVSTYAQLQQSGINVVAGLDSASNGFKALGQLSTITGVRFTELSASMIKYNSAINAFTVGKFAKTVADSKASLYEFGFTAKETAELTGSFLESQMGFTNARNESEADTTVKVIKFGKSITNLSMATGMARSALLANIEAISKSTEANILAAQVGDDAATSTLSFISSFSDQNVGRAFLKMMTDQIKPLNQTFQSFQKIGLGGFIQRYMQFQKNIQNLSAEDKARAMAEFTQQNQNVIESAKKQANLFSQMPDLAGDANAVLGILVGMQQQERKYAEVKEADRKKLKETNDARSKLSSEWERLMSKFQAVFIPPIKIMESLTYILTKLNDTIEWVTDALGPEISSWVGFLGVAGAGLGLFIKSIAGITRVLSVVGIGLPKLITAPVNFLVKSMGLLGNMFSGFVRVLLSPFSMLKNIFTSSVGFMGNIISKIGGLFSGVMPIISKIGGFALKFAGAIGLLYSAFEAGWAIGTQIYKIISQFNIVNAMFETVFSGIDHLLQYIPGSVGSDASDRISTKEKLNASQYNTSKVEISVPTSPKPSSIDSPSSKNTKDSKLATESTSSFSPSTPVGAGIEKPPAQTDINSMMAFQNSLMEQLLLSTNRLVSVNKDILKYTKSHT